MNYNDMFNTTVENLFGEEVDTSTKGQLEKEFIVPPFSVFDTKQGYWQDRKRIWKELGIKSELGRGDNLENVDENNKLGKCLPKTFDAEKYGKKWKAMKQVFSILYYAN